MTEWKTVRANSKPGLIDNTTSSYVVYERRNIHEVELPPEIDDDGRPINETCYEYEEREYGKDEYASLTSPATTAVMQAVNEAVVEMLGVVLDV